MVINRIILIAVFICSGIGICVGCKEKSIMKSNRQFIYNIAFSKGVNFYLALFTTCAGILFGFWSFIAGQLYLSLVFDIGLIAIYIALALVIGSLINIIYCCNLIKSK